MKSLFTLCHMCGSYDSEIVTPAFLANGSFCNFQKIVICRKCGLVYKNPVIPELNHLSYSKKSWGDGKTFKQRISELASYLSNFTKTISPQTILEIGPGPGWLTMFLQDVWPNSKYILYEASEEVAQLAQKNLPNAMVVPDTIDNTFLNSNFVDLAIVCGVDYLFCNFRQTIEKLHGSLSENGYIYIERNVFVETEAYAGSSIRTYKDLFGQNVLMTTWFSVSQYKQFLTHYFEIISERSFVHDETDGFKCIIHGYLCKKKTGSNKYYDGNISWYKTNMESLARLSKDNIT